MGFKLIEAADTTFQLWHNQKGAPSKHGGQQVIHRGQLWGGSVQSGKDSEKRPLLFEMIDGKMHNTTKVKCGAYAGARVSLTTLDDRLYMGFCTEDHKIYLGYNSSPKSRGWTRLAVPDPPVKFQPQLTITSFHGSIYMVAVGVNQKIYWNKCHHENAALQGYNGNLAREWTVIEDQQTDHAAALCVFKATLYLLYTRTDGKGVNYGTFSSQHLKWTNFDTWKYPGTITSAPATTVHHTNKLWLMFRGHDTFIKYTKFDGSTWSTPKYIKESQCKGDQSIGSHNGWIYFSFEEMKKDEKKDDDDDNNDNNVSQVPDEESDDDFYDEKAAAQDAAKPKKRRWYKKLFCF